MHGFMVPVNWYDSGLREIAAVGNLSASLIAGDIQVALLTTVLVLLWRYYFQIFY